MDQAMMWWKYAEKITIFIMFKKCESVMLQKTELASIRHHAPKRQCKAIMRIGKMQALRNEMPEQNPQDGSRTVSPSHVSEC